MLEPIKKSRIYEHIVEQIRSLVADGKLKPGDQLPPERELASTFRVSRTSVREALRALETQGLIVGKQGGGTYIKEMSPEVLVQRLAAVQLNGARDIQEILEVRELIEPGIARLAAKRATPELIAELARLVERQRVLVEAGESYAEADAAFHLTLAVAAANRTLLRLQNTIMDLLQESRAANLQGPDRPTRSLQGHEQILAAVQRHDGEAAFQATLLHISAVRDAILARVSDGAQLDPALASRSRPATS